MSSRQIAREAKEQLREMGRKVTGVTQIPLYVFDRPTLDKIHYNYGIQADHSGTFELLDMAGLNAPNGRIPYPFIRLFSQSTYITGIDNSTKRLFKGSWFYTENTGLNEDGIKTMKKDGKLRQIIGEISMEEKILLLPGPHPIVFHIVSDEEAIRKGRRFVLEGRVEPTGIAPMVIGFPKESVSTLELSEPAEKLVREIRSITSNLRKSRSEKELEERILTLAKKTAELTRLLRSDVN